MCPPSRVHCRYGGVNLTVVVGSKALPAVLRFLFMRNLDNFSQETLQLSNIWFFGIQYVVGTYIWTLSWPAGTTPTFLGSGSTGTDLSTTWIVSMLILAVNAVALAIACHSLTNMHRSSQRLRKINSPTLDCLLGSHRLLQRQLQVFYGQLAIGQLAESLSYHPKTQHRL